MDYVYVGRIITTHGIKGEIKIKSNFDKKDYAFVVGNTLYIGGEKVPRKILSYRMHKGYDMFILEGISNIEDAIALKQQLVFADRKEINIDIINDDLLGFKAIYKNMEIGIVLSITNEGLSNIIFRLDTNILIPNNPHFIEKIDKDKKEIYFKNLEGLL